MPFFSVVIPLYNKEDLIEHTISGLLNQSFTDFEVIIVNDGSTDNSLEKIHHLVDNRFIIINQDNKGASFARNIGIENANGKYIALLDADDYWDINHLVELKKLIKTFPNAGLYCNNYQIYYTKDVVRPANFNFYFNKDCLIVEDFFKASITNSVAWTSAVGFTKEKFYTIGCFNKTLKTAQDLDLWIKMALKYDVAFNPTITMSYKSHVDNSLSKSKYNDIRYEFINNFSKEEKENPSLKVYLDINRYAVAIRCKLNNEKELYQKLKSEIDYSNLNFKQKLLLNSPRVILKTFKQIHEILVKNGIYFSANR
ncbi:glycosyltransferase family 2 protein [Algibacter sp.]|nr:glycosyltransferase family A protein [Algibacter sp.]MDA9069472.1 glycosyltransferase family 2 protein [Algibacter sp.]MDA9343683.1 glycosyltransferase family 2 protein [Algibacter sp.]MDC1226792.1 glycosyltransferase family 2 protein [Algibacter sp.]